VEVPDQVLALAEGVRAAGGRLFVVGGAVRDHLLGHPAKDLDLEVHGLDPTTLAGLLSGHGTARRVGRSFPVFKLMVAGLGELDVALPRGQEPGLDPIAEAARHRDLTVNALLYDPLSGELLDPWNGQADLRARRLRAVDPDTFGQDPLRALRVAVLAARLQAEPDPQLARICAQQDLSAQAPERIGLELHKLWLRAPDPAPGLVWIRDLGLGPAVLPGVALTSDRIDAMVRAAAQADLLEESGPGPRAALCWATLLLHHADPEQVLDRASVHSVRRWPVRDRVLALGPAPLRLPSDDRGLTALADNHRIWLALRRHAAWHPASPALTLLARARDLGIATAPLPQLLQGRDLVALGVEPGPGLGRLLTALRAAQLAGAVGSVAQARFWVQARIGCAPPDEHEPPP